MSTGKRSLNKFALITFLVVLVAGFAFLIVEFSGMEEDEPVPQARESEQIP